MACRDPAAHGGEDGVDERVRREAGVEGGGLEERVRAAVGGRGGGEDRAEHRGEVLTTAGARERGRPLVKWAESGSLGWEADAAAAVQLERHESGREVAARSCGWRMVCRQCRVAGEEEERGLCVVLGLDLLCSRLHMPPFPATNTRCAMHILE